MRLTAVTVVLLGILTTTACTGADPSAPASPTDGLATPAAPGSSPSASPSTSPSTTGPTASASPVPTASVPPGPSAGPAPGDTASGSAAPRRPAPAPSTTRSTATPAPGTAAPSPTASQQTEAPQPAASSTAVPAVAGASDECWGLLTDENRRVAAEQAADGLAFTPDFETRAVTESPDTFARMTGPGGVLCSFGFPGTDNTWSYGYSPADVEQDADLPSLLDSRGYVRTESAEGAVYCLPLDSFEDCFLFRAGELFWSTSEAALPDLVRAAHD